MKISISNTAPSTKEIANILEHEFSDRYSYELFGLGSDKSIIVRKSTFVGVQISRRNNEFTIEGITSSFFTISLPLFFGVAGSPLHIWSLFFHSPWQQFEKEIGGFLKQKFN